MQELVFFFFAKVLINSYNSFQIGNSNTVVSVYWRRLSAGFVNNISIIFIFLGYQLINWYSSVRKSNRSSLVLIYLRRNKTTKGTNKYQQKHFVKFVNRAKLGVVHYDITKSGRAANFGPTSISFIHFLHLLNTLLLFWINSAFKKLGPSCWMYCSENGILHGTRENIV